MDPDNHDIELTGMSVVSKYQQILLVHSSIFTAMLLNPTNTDGVIAKGAPGK